MRVRTPWIEALRESREPKSKDNEAPPAKPDTTPKRMSDSYVRIVGLQSEWHLTINLSIVDLTSRAGSVAARQLWKC